MSTRTSAAPVTTLTNYQEPSGKQRGLRRTSACRESLTFGKVAFHRVAPGQTGGALERFHSSIDRPHHPSAMTLEHRRHNACTGHARVRLADHPKDQNHCGGRANNSRPSLQTDAECSPEVYSPCRRTDVKARPEPGSRKEDPLLVQQTPQVGPWEICVSLSTRENPKKSKSILFTNSLKVSIARREGKSYEYGVFESFKGPGQLAIASLVHNDTTHVNLYIL